MSGVVTATPEDIDRAYRALADRSPDEDLRSQADDLIDKLAQSAPRLRTLVAQRLTVRKASRQRVLDDRIAELVRTRETALKRLYQLLWSLFGGEGTGDGT